MVWFQQVYVVKIEKTLIAYAQGVRALNNKQAFLCGKEHRDQIYTVLTSVSMCMLNHDTT